MAITLFNNADPTSILDLLYRDCSSEEVTSVQFRADVPPVRSLSDDQQWLRLVGILGRSQVYDALGISTLPMTIPAMFFYSKGLEVIGTLANLLNRGGIHNQFVDNFDNALSESRRYLDAALMQNYDAVEAYSCHGSWCNWFIGEGILDETILVGNRGDWWLLVVTSTD